MGIVSHGVIIMNKNGLKEHIACFLYQQKHFRRTLIPYEELELTGRLRLYYQLIHSGHLDFNPWKVREIYGEVMQDYDGTEVLQPPTPQHIETFHRPLQHKTAGNVFGYNTDIDTVPPEAFFVIWRGPNGAIISINDDVPLSELK